MEFDIREIIKKELNLEAVEIKEISEGFSHKKYFVTTNGLPRDLVIRFENKSSINKGLKAEEIAINKVRELGIPAPKIYVCNSEYMIMEKLKGTRLDTIWSNLTINEKIQVTKEIGRLSAKIHEIKFDKFGEFTNSGELKQYSSIFSFKNEGGKVESNNFYFRELMSSFFKDIARLMSFKSIMPQLPAKIVEYMMKNYEDIAFEGEPTLIHGDFHRDHIFVEREGENYKIVGIIDFEFAAFKAPEYDLIKLHRQGFFDNAELEKAFMEGYNKPINKKAIEISRMTRDFAFGAVLLDSGKTQEGIKILKEVESKIDKELSGR